MSTARSLRPVIVGGDIGAYGSARAFHEAYAVRTVVLAGVATGPVAHSSIVDLRVVKNLDDDDVLTQALHAVLAEEPGVPHIILGSADHAVHALVRIRHRLGPDAVVPYVGQDTLDRVTTKAGFSRLCAELGVPHPRTLVVRPGDDAVDLADVTYPAVVKASSSAEFHAVEFDGKRKVAYVEDEAELRTLLATMATAGFTGEVVVQERIAGSDEDMAAVNVFCAHDGRVQFALFGQVLLEEATPNGLGNSAAQITGTGGAAGAEAVEHARRLLEHIGWTGFANLDLKRDPTDGRYRFFELNPRVGRSGYAVTAAGYNVARMYGQEYVVGDRSSSPARAGGSDQGQPQIGDAEHLFVVVPLALLRRYVSEPVWRRVRELRRRGAVTNPYYYRAERHPRRWLYVLLAMINQMRKFRRWH